MRSSNFCKVHSSSHHLSKPSINNLINFYFIKYSQCTPENWNAQGEKILLINRSHTYPGYYLFRVLFIWSTIYSEYLSGVLLVRGTIFLEYYLSGILFIRGTYAAYDLSGVLLIEVLFIRVTTYLGIP